MISGYAVLRETRVRKEDYETRAGWVGLGWDEAVGVMVMRRRDVYG